MQVASVSVRFGLILEAYCRGSQDHITILAKQLECLEKLKKCSELVRLRRDKEKARALLQEQLSSESIDCNVRSPLDPSFRCTRIRWVLKQHFNFKQVLNMFSLKEVCTSVSLVVLQFKNLQNNFRNNLYVAFLFVFFAAKFIFLYYSTTTLTEILYVRNKFV